MLRHIILGDTFVGDSVCDWVIILYSKTKIFRRQRYAIQRYAKDKEIYEIATRESAENATIELIKRANENGGLDNITIIVIKNI